MKSIKLIKNLLTLFGCLAVSTAIFAKNPDWTDVKECENTVSRFDKNAFSNLFNRAPNLIFESGKVCSNGSCRPACYIDIICKTGCDTESKFKDQGIRTIYGGIQLYRQDDSATIFAENNKKFGAKSKVKFTKDQSSPLKDLFPWAVEGYYEFQEDATNQQFSVYTKNGDYIVFILNYKHIKPYKQPSPNQIDERFIQFIQTTARQMGY